MSLHERLEAAIAAQRATCERLVGSATPHPAVANASDHCARAASALAALPADGFPALLGADTAAAVQAVLKAVVQSVLDSTFAEQDPLVEDDFPDLAAAQGVLAAIAAPIKQLFGPGLERNDEVVSAVLSRDVADCVLWRQAELVYMVAHTLANDEARSADLRLPVMVEMAELAVDCVQRLTRSGGDFDEMGQGGEYVSDLVQAGVRSDSHLLALMYAGELCYWMAESQGEGQGEGPGGAAAAAAAADGETQRQRFRARGTRFLTVFVAVVEAHQELRRSWNCDRARQLLAVLA